MLKTDQAAVDDYQGHCVYRASDEYPGHVITNYSSREGEFSDDHLVLVHCGENPSFYFILSVYLSFCLSALLSMYITIYLKVYHPIYPSIFLLSLPISHSSDLRWKLLCVSRVSNIFLVAHSSRPSSLKHFGTEIALLVLCVDLCLD